VKVGEEDIFKPINGTEGVLGISDDSEVSVVNFCHIQEPN
jgi:hypothetical protein